MNARFCLSWAMQDSEETEAFLPFCTFSICTKVPARSWRPCIRADHWSAETFVASFTQVVKASVGQGVLGSWQFCS